MELREHHITCLEAVDAQQATVGANGYAIGGRPLSGDLHLAMADLRIRRLVYGTQPDAVEPELLWLTETGEQALAESKQTEEIR